MGATTKKIPPSTEGGIAAETPVDRRLSTNSDLARLDSLRLWKMDGQQALLYTSADPRRVDAGIQIENAPILAHLAFTIDRSSKVVCRGGAMATKDELAVCNGYLYALLAHTGHLDLQGKSVRILVKIHNRSEILNALSRFGFSWCYCRRHNRVKFGPADGWTGRTLFILVQLESFWVWPLQPSAK